MDILKLKSKFGLNNFELANFLGQCAHESANFRATSENPPVKFYGVESYQFKNPKQKDFMELNAKVQGLYFPKQMIVPYVGAELIFNPDGRLKPVIEYGYFYDNKNLYPYWVGGVQVNVIRF